MDILKQISEQHPKMAFVVGNGPNLRAGIMPEWKELLKASANQPIQFETEGLSNTEVYDLVDLHSAVGHDVKRQVISNLKLVPGHDLSIHRRLMELAQTHQYPVLTTNFDAAFEKSVNAPLRHISSANFTRYYPWKSYYGRHQHQLPTDGFGIWKIHGDVRYKDSIRLGLTDYMGSVERARNLLHKGKDRLFQAKPRPDWQGRQTWLHIWFHLPLVIFGLGFGTDEVFLRWLLIERRKYLKTLGLPMAVYFIYRSTPLPATLNLMHNLGVEMKQVQDYGELYG